MRAVLSLLLVGALCGSAFSQDDALDQKVLKTLQRLSDKQKDAVNRLEDQLQRIKEIEKTLRRQGNTAKADLLQQVVEIVTKPSIGITPVATAGGSGSETLGDLRAAMNAMARMLQEHPDRTEEVAVLGRKVIETLQKVVEKLTGQRDIAALADQEKALSNARQETARLADLQRRLKEETKSTMGKTAAEEAAAKGRQDLQRLLDQLSDLQQQTKESLRNLDAKRERASRLQDLADRQRRIASETAVREGATDVLTPRVNRALAELDAIAREARKEASQAAARDAQGRLAREVKSLEDRQNRIRKELADRKALESALDALHRKGEGGAKSASTLKDALEAAAKVAPDAEAQAMRNAARNPEDAGARAAAEKAVQSALDHAASRETLSQDEQALSRDIERAAKEPAVPADALDALNKATEQARETAGKLAGGQKADAAAKAVSEALARARDELEKSGSKGGAPQESAGQAQRRQDAIARAKAVAGALEKLQGDQGAQNAGLSGVSEEGKRAARKAAEELTRAGEATAQQDPLTARTQAEHAAERLERAARDLRDAIQPHDDLSQRQAQVGEELRGLAEGAQDKAEQAALGKTGSQAAQAADALKASRFAQAGKIQKQILKDLSALAAGAKKEAEEAAKKDAGALKAAQQATQGAQKNAAGIAKDLEAGARSAREEDSRNRLKEAQARTAAAAEDLRRALQRLQDAFPKGAEQDQRDAMEAARRARDQLDGLHESHGSPSAGQRKRLEDLAQQQKKLEAQVAHLQDQLRKLKEQSGKRNLDDAQAAMREAESHLSQGEGDEAERAQDRAQKSLERAKDKMQDEERRYRSLRQYELLFRLKEELGAFRRAAETDRESLQQIDAEVRRKGRVPRYLFLSRIEPLRKQISDLRRDVDSKASAIEKEGAVVYTYILHGCSNDLSEVTDQLQLREVGIVPQEILANVVHRLDLALKGLDRDLSEKRKQQQQQGGGQQQQGGQGRPRLVPPDAEIRMVLVLQQGLNQERENFFKNRPDFGTRPLTPSEQSRLQRLYHEQGSLAELFDGLRQSLLGQSDEHGPKFKDQPKGN